MHRLLIGGGLAALSLAGVLPADAGRTESAEALLRREPRLQAKVTVAAQDEPVADFLDRLAKETRVVLKASRETQDDRVTLYARDRPAADLLLAVSTHFDFQWRRRGAGFELGQDLAAQRRQAAAREAIRAAQLTAIRARIERIAGLQAEPRPNLEQRRRDLLRDAADPRLPPAQRRERQEELAVLSAALQPGAPLGIAFSRLLGPRHYDALRAGTEVRFATRDGSLPASLAGPIHDAARDARSASRSVRVETRGGAAPPVGVAPEPPDAKPPTGASVSVTFDRGPSGLFAGLGRRSNQPPGLHFVFSSIRGGPGDQSVFPVTWTVPAPGADAAPGGEEDPALDQEVELFPVERRNPAAPPAGTAQPAIRTITPGDLLAGQVRLSEVAKRLHEKTGLSLLSDSFVRCRLPEGLLRGKRKVSQFLEVIARQLDYTWALAPAPKGAASGEPRLVRLRDAVYFDDRPAEIPERLLTGWRAKLERSGSFSLDELAEIVAGLADGQVLNLQNYWPWYLEGGKSAPPETPHNLFSVRHHLRFWATLSAQQRRAARADIIPTRLLNNQQKAAFLKALVASDGFAFREVVESAPPTRAELDAGGFRLETSTGEMTEYRGRVGEGEVIVRSVGAPQRPPGTPPGPAPVPMLPGGLDLQLLARSTTTLDSYSFRYHLAANPEPARTATVQVPRPARKVEPEQP